MQENLVIVESPAKAKKIEEFLGKDYKVMSSYGHIRDLKKKELSINEKTMEPDYEIPEEKKKLVTELKTNAKKAKLPTPKCPTLVTAAGANWPLETSGRGHVRGREILPRNRAKVARFLTGDEAR